MCKIINNNEFYSGINKKNEIVNLEDFDLNEETSRYGEFISSYFVWLGLNKQKDRAEELNEMTKTKTYILYT